MARVRLEIGVTPAPLMPTTIPSSHRSLLPGRNARVGNVLASVTPAWAPAWRFKTSRIATITGAIDVTAAVSLNNFGTSGSPASSTHSTIFAVNSASCETMSPLVPSPPCGHESEYSMPQTPAASSLRVLDCHAARSASSRPLTGPPVEASVSRSGNSLRRRPTSRHTRSSA